MGLPCVCAKYESSTANKLKDQYFRCLNRPALFVQAKRAFNIEPGFQGCQVSDGSYLFSPAWLDRVQGTHFSLSDNFTKDMYEIPVVSAPSQKLPASDSLP